MALRDKLRERIQPLLEPGEQIQHVFMAQTASQYTILVPIWFLIQNRYRVVAVTDRNVVVLEAARMQNSKPTGVLTRLPRNTPLGTPDGMWHVIELGGENLRVHKRFHKDIEEASGIGGLATA
jgi:hypothetical protein